jgi:hypothetical protein
MLDSFSLLKQPHELRRRFQQDGYVLVRGLVPTAAVQTCRTTLCNILEQEGYLVEGSNPQDAVVRDMDLSPGFLQRQEASTTCLLLPSASRSGRPNVLCSRHSQVAHLPDVLAVLEHQNIRAVAEILAVESSGKSNETSSALDRVEVVTPKFKVR